MTEENKTNNIKPKAKLRARPSFPVRFLHFLWRRRRWQRIRKTHERISPNWAEKIALIVAFCLFCVAVVQACIYWQQAQIMIAELAVAGRSAKAAEDAAKGMKGQLGIAQKQLVDFERNERAILSVESEVYEDKITFVVKNVGHSAALQVSEFSDTKSDIAPQHQPTVQQLESYLRPIPPDVNGPTYEERKEKRFDLDVPNGTELYRRLQAGQDWVAYIKFGYMDIFGNTYHASGCLILNLGKGGRHILKPCPAVGLGGAVGNKPGLSKP